MAMPSSFGKSSGRPETLRRRPDHLRRSDSRRFEGLGAGKTDLAAYLGGADVERAERLLLHEKGIAVFPTPDRAVKAYSCHVRFAKERFPREPERPPAAAAPAGTGKSLSPADSMAFLEREGVNVVPSRQAGVGG